MNGQEIRVYDLGSVGEMLLRCRPVATKNFALDLLDNPGIIHVKVVPEVTSCRDVVKRGQTFNFSRR